MDKKLTFKEYIERERNREKILETTIGQKEVLDSARKINEITLSNKNLSQNLNSFIKSQQSTYDKIADIVKNIESSPEYSRIKNLTQSPSFKEWSNSYNSLFESISPISKYYHHEIDRIRKNIEESGRTSAQEIINSEPFIEAKKLQEELIRIDPSIGISPITTLERSIEAEEPDPFDKATRDITNIELVEQLKITGIDKKLLEKNPSPETPTDILIVTGLPLELRIFCDVFNVESRWFSEKFCAEYYFGKIISDNTTYTVALTFGEDMGNFHASQITNAAMEDLNPKIVISAGIGYTLNPNKLQLCDLHITDSIVHWGLTSKEYEKHGRKVRTIPIRVKSNHIFQEIRKYTEGLRIGKTPFAQWVEDSRVDQPSVTQEKIDVVLAGIDKAIKCGIPSNFFNERPKVEIGKTMVSDDAVVASILEIKKRSLSEAGNENYISGEMEAAGVAMALASRKALTEFIAIRGISDFGFGKEAMEASSHEFRMIAATRAATFIRSFFESNPTLNINNNNQKLGTPI